MVDTNTKSPYTYVIYKLDNVVQAQNGSTGDVEFSGINDAKVIQSAVNIGYGSVLIKNTMSDYIINSRILLPPGVDIISDGAILDVSNLDTIVFNITSDGTVAKKRSIISGLYTIGNTNNLNTLFFKVEDFPRGLILRDIRFKNVNNIIEVKGSSWSTIVENLQGQNVKGICINIYDGIAGKAPHSCMVNNVEMSQSLNVGTGVKIQSINNDIQGVRISNCWFEGFDIALYNEGYWSIIDGNILTANTGIYNASTNINNSGNRAVINGNVINYKSRGIDIRSNYSLINISNNIIRRDNGTNTLAIYNIGSYPQIIGNIINTSEGALKGLFAHCIISNNYIDSIGTAIETENFTDYSIIEGNYFVNSNTGILGTYLRYGNISDNIFRNVKNAINIVNRTGTIIHNNKGYNTESNILSNVFDISSTGLKMLTIVHGLDIIPNVQDCYLTVVQNTIVDDWAYDMIKIVSTDVKNVTVKINISKASATVGATAKLALRVGY